MFFLTVLVSGVSCTALPIASGMPRSVNLIEGDTLELECEPWGWPKPTVSWERESAPLNLSDPRVTAGKDLKLVIESVVQDDRDKYFCVVTSSFNDTEHKAQKGTIVRVKGWLIFCMPQLQHIAL